MRITSRILLVTNDRHQIVPSVDAIQSACPDQRSVSLRSGGLTMFWECQAGAPKVRALKANAVCRIWASSLAAAPMILILNRGQDHSPRLNPSRQLLHFGRQSSSRPAFAFDAPRTCVMKETPTSPTTSRPMNVGTRRGGFAPTAAAKYGSHSETGAGSSSTML